MITLIDRQNLLIIPSTWSSKSYSDTNIVIIYKIILKDQQEFIDYNLDLKIIWISKLYLIIKLSKFLNGRLSEDSLSFKKQQDSIQDQDIFGSKIGF